MIKIGRQEKSASNTLFVMIGLTVVNIALIGVTAAFGLFVTDFYSAEKLSLRVQSLGQDLINGVVIVPLLAVSLFLVTRKIQLGAYLLVSTNLYLIYTFMIYCFDLHFNSLFLCYCCVLGLSFYSILFMLYTNALTSYTAESSILSRTTGIFFIILSASFALLWISQILPPILNHSTPAMLTETGLPTNPVHVLDLSFFLPGLFIAGILLLKRHPLGNIVSAVFLIFTSLMTLTIAGLMVVNQHFELPSSEWITSAMLLVSLFSLLLIYLRVRKTSVE